MDANIESVLLNLNSYYRLVELNGKSYTKRELKLILNSAKCLGYKYISEINKSDIDAAIRCGNETNFVTKKTK